MSQFFHRHSLALVASAAGLIAAYMFYMRRKAQLKIVDKNEAEKEKIRKVIDRKVETPAKEVKIDNTQKENNVKLPSSPVKVTPVKVVNNTPAEKKETTTTTTATPCDTLMKPLNINMNWSEEVEKVTSDVHKVVQNGSETNTQNANNMAARRRRNNNVQLNSAPNQQQTSVKRTAESPSIESSHSQTSADSGHFTSNGLTTSMSPVDEMREMYNELPAMYEFEIPQTLVGLVIGIKGQTVKEISQLSDTTMVIRRDHPAARSGFQVCTVEGKRAAVNLCLQLLRRKFPMKRFPELNLKPVIPPMLQGASGQLSNMTVAQTPMLTLPEGISIEVALANVQSPSHFFLNQPTHPTFPMLARLDEYMEKVYANPVGVPPLPKPIEPGVLCVAPMCVPPWDRGWYRAVTCAYMADTDEVLIKYVDYGGYARIATDELRQIRSDFTTLPFQAVECYLAHVVPVPSKDCADGVLWSAEACELFSSVAIQKIIEATVVGRCSDDSMPMVELTTVYNGRRTDIGRLLVDSGYATYRNSPSVSPPSDMVASPSPSS